MGRFGCTLGRTLAAGWRMASRRGGCGTGACRRDGALAQGGPGDGFERFWKQNQRASLRLSLVQSREEGVGARLGSHRRSSHSTASWALGLASSCTQAARERKGQISESLSPWRVEGT